MGWWIVLAVLVLLALLPLGIRVRYDADGVCLRVVIGPAAWKIYPSRKKKPKKKEAQEKETSEKTEAKPDKRARKNRRKAKEKTGTSDSAKEAAAKAEAKADKGGSLTDFLPLLRLALDFLGDLRRKLRVDRLFAYVVLAGDDPCDLAVNYGRANGALGALMPKLERLFVIKKQDVQIGCDFEADKTLITVDLQLTITLGRSLMLLTIYGFRALREIMKLKKLRKGGTNHGSDIT